MAVVTLMAVGITVLVATHSSGEPANVEKLASGQQ